MLKRLKGIYSDESGQILPLFAVMIVVLLGITAVVVDGGRMYHLKNETHNIAEASALSTIDFLKTDADENVVRDVAMDYALSNGAKEEEVIILTNYSAVNDAGDIVKEVTVKVSREHNMFFGGIVSGSDTKVTGKYTVQSSYDGVSPDDADHSFALYTFEQIDDLVETQGHIPIASAKELNSLRNKTKQTFGKGTVWENAYTSEMSSSYILVSDIDLKEIGNFKPICTFGGVFDGGGA